MLALMADLAIAVSHKKSCGQPGRSLIKIFVQNNYLLRTVADLFLNADHLIIFNQGDTMHISIILCTNVG